MNGEVPILETLSLFFIGILEEEIKNCTEVVNKELKDKLKKNVSSHIENVLQRVKMKLINLWDTLQWNCRTLEINRKKLSFQNEKTDYSQE